MKTRRTHKAYSASSYDEWHSMWNKALIDELKTRNLVKIQKRWDCDIEGHVWLPVSLVASGVFPKVFNGINYNPEICNYCRDTQETQLDLEGHKSVYSLREAQRREIEEEYAKEQRKYHKPKGKVVYHKPTFENINDLYQMPWGIEVG